MDFVERVGKIIHCKLRFGLCVFFFFVVVVVLEKWVGCLLGFLEEKRRMGC